MEQNNKEINKRENLELNIKNFSGPLDILYNLIKEKKYDILSLDLLDVVNQYLDYLSLHIQSIKTDEIIDDLVMLTYLLELKSKKMLPSSNNDKDIDDEMEKDRFIQRILLQRQFKDLVPQLTSRLSERTKHFMRNDSNEEINKNIYIEDANLPESISPKILLNAMQRIYKRLIDEENETIKKIDIKELSIDDVTKEIISLLKILNKDNKVSLFLLFNAVPKEKISKQYMAVAFVSILVLARHSYISLRQDDYKTDEDIYITILDLEQNIDLHIMEEITSDEGEKNE